MSEENKISPEQWAQGPTSGYTPLPENLSGAGATTAEAITGVEAANAAASTAEEAALQEAELKRMADLRIAAVLSELHAALERCLTSGENYTIYLGKTGLLETEQVELLNKLGEGSIHLKMSNTDEPAEWYESLISGIWVGTFKNHRGEAILRTIEVARFPEIASAQNYDIEQSLSELADKLAALTSE